MSEENNPAPGAATPATNDVKVDDAIKAQRAGSANAPAAPTSLKIRGFSKIVLFWPTFVASLVMYFLGGAWGYGELVNPNSLAVCWMLVFAMNLLVFTFDFGRNNFITLVAVLAVIVLGLLALDMSMGGVFSGIMGFFTGMNVAMNANVYLCFAVIFGIFLLLALVRSRFDYWEIGQNELVHHHGILGDVRAYSTLNLKVEKEIPDVFEWLLFGSGRLIFKPSNSNRDDQVLMVDNVFRVNRAEAQIRKSLSSIRVDTELN